MRNNLHGTNGLFSTFRGLIIFLGEPPQRSQSTKRDHRLQASGTHQGAGAVTTMIKEAEAELGFVEVIAANVQLLNCVVKHIMCQTNVFGSGTASFIVIWRKICAEGTE